MQKDFGRGRALLKKFLTQMLSLVVLPSASSTDLLANVGTLFTDLWVIIALAIGIPLAFYVIKRVIALVPKGR